MSKLVARMQKLKAENLTGLGNHNSRKTDNHSNKEIDVSLSHKNYDLVNGNEPIDFKKDIENYINETKSTKPKTRKDAVLVSEWIISASKEVFEGLSEDEVERYFQLNVDWFQEEFGKDNVQYGIVHVDETTPHMHLGVVPFDDDQKLSSKRVFNRQALLKVQNELPKYLQSNGFDVERGEPTDGTRGKSIHEFKKDTLKEYKRELKADLTVRNEAKQEIIDELLPKYKREVKQEVAEGEKKRFDEEIANEKAKLQDEAQKDSERQKTALKEELKRRREKDKQKVSNYVAKQNERFKVKSEKADRIISIHESLAMDVYEMKPIGGKYNIPYATQEMLLKRLSEAGTATDQKVAKQVEAQQNQRNKKKVTRSQHKELER